MNRALYIFNPWHDLALANGDPNFNAPRSALQFENDCCEIPLWYAGTESLVFCNKDLEQWLDKIKHIFPQLSTIELTDNIENQTFRTICPWGWDDAIKNKLISFGLNSEIFLQQGRLTKIRELSNRKLAIVGLQYLIKNIGYLDCFPNTPIILTNIDEVVDFRK